MAMTKEEAHQLLRDAGAVTYSYDIAESATQDYGDMFAVYVLRKKYLQSGDIGVEGALIPPAMFRRQTETARNSTFELSH